MKPPRCLCITVCLAAMGTGLAMSPRLLGQEVAGATPTAQHPQVSTTSNCRDCHTCDQPTREAACLRSCSRPQVPAVSAAPVHAAPDMVLLDDLVDRYLPVPFDHKGHSRMAEMAGGCGSCHHFSPQDQPFPACRSCHELTPVHQDIHKPGLKGAYHRQCLNCHREWSESESCSLCHMPRTNGGSSESTQIPHKDDITGRMHPPIPEPDTEIFGQLASEAPASRVIFRHKEHIHRFGLACVECHHESNCSRCHQAQQPLVGVEKTLLEHHQPCMRCHNVEAQDGCNKCHWNDDAAQPPPFDHRQTGWPLNRFHEPLGCRSCHTSVPFTALDPACNTCHADWAPGRFDHAVTGQSLDDKHAKADCSSCHADKNFSKPPTCDECHEEDEGISFPARRPGEMRGK